MHVSHPERLRRGAAVLFKAGFDAVLPPRCLGCGVIVPTAGDVCPVCWPELRFIAGPACERCAKPIEVASALDGPPTCPACILEPPAFARARAALAYDGLARALILRFKHGDRLDGVRTFGRWLTNAGRDLWDDADLIVPVPAHPWRMVRRGYNQSALLAQATGRGAGVAVAVDLLRRRRATASQQGLSAEARRKNVTTIAFDVHPRWRSRMAERRVVLLDDVFTTGATLDACAKVLKTAGAAAVDVLALARVAGGTGEPI